MDTKTVTITQKVARWQVTGTPEDGGSLSFAQDGAPFLDCLHNRLDDTTFDVTRSRSFHKGGIAVCEFEASLADGSAAISQITRLAANVARVCTDVTLRAGRAIADALAIGSFTLEGRWTRLTVFGADGAATSQELVPGGAPLRWTSPLPLAWLLEREDGFRVEVGTGFDAWRWQQGLEMPSAVEVTLQTMSHSLSFERAIAANHDETPNEDGIVGLLPQPRVYRLCHHLAWTTDACAPRTSDALPPQADITAGGLDCAALPDHPELTLDLSTLPLPASARLNGTPDALPCWESRVTLAAAKRLVRQLASHPTGRLHVTGGLSPAPCSCGTHVDRPRKTTAHWGLNAIVCFAQWTRQTLGNGWDISCDIPQPWNQLPSLQGLFAINGFSEQDRG